MKLGPFYPISFPFPLKDIKDNSKSNQILVNLFWAIQLI